MKRHMDSITWSSTNCTNFTAWDTDVSFPVSNESAELMKALLIEMLDLDASCYAPAVEVANEVKDLVQSLQGLVEVLELELKELQDG